MVLGLGNRLHEKGLQNLKNRRTVRPKLQGGFSAECSHFGLYFCITRPRSCQGGNFAAAARLPREPAHRRTAGARHSCGVRGTAGVTAVVRLRSANIAPAPLSANVYETPLHSFRVNCFFVYCKTALMYPSDKQLVLLNFTFLFIIDSVIMGFQTRAAGPGPVMKT
jgi:hypothetical protein